MWCPRVLYSFFRKEKKNTSGQGSRSLNVGCSTLNGPMSQIEEGLKNLRLKVTACIVYFFSCVWLTQFTEEDQCQGGFGLWSSYRQWY